MPSPSERGSRIGEYELLFELASGGMATIVVARQAGDAGFERLVALKRIHKHLISDPEVFAMASDEARFAALVRHPNVVPVIGVLDQQGELVLVQEYVEGASAASLAKRARERGEPLPPAVATRIVCDALLGLHAAHEAKDLRGEPLELVHRDVSPQNMMVGSDGITRLIDFGIARATERLAKTRTGIVKGKLHYMAPEQIEEREVDRRADVFAAAAVLVELVTGARPFGSGAESAVMGRILIGDADTEKLGELAPALVPVVRAALSSDVGARPSTALELKKAIAQALPPADTEEVSAFVERVIGMDLVALREKIKSSLGALVSEEDDLDAQAPAAPPAPAAPTPSRRATRWWLFPVAAGAALSLVAVLSLGSPGRASAPLTTSDSSSATADSTTARALPSASEPGPSQRATATPSQSAVPSASAIRTAQQRPQPLASTAQPTASTGLMPSPYTKKQ